MRKFFVWAACVVSNPWGVEYQCFNTEIYLAKYQTGEYSFHMFSNTMSLAEITGKHDNIKSISKYFKY